MKRLRSCEGCARHVFVTERVCPFCLTELTAAPARAQVAVPSTASRAQRLALAAAAALGGQGLLACADTVGTDPGTQNGGTGQDTVEVPVYGAPVAGQKAQPTAGSPPPAAGRGGAVDGGVVAPAYGAPLAGQPAPQPTPPDAGASDAGAADEDGGLDEAVAGAGGRGGMASPVYGAPIPEYGAPPPKD